MNLKIEPVSPLWLLLLSFLVGFSGCQTKGIPEAPTSFFTPVAWQEIARVTSPSKSVDAVLVSRFGAPLGDTDYDGEITQYNLYLLPRGEQVGNDPPYPADELSDQLGRAYKETVLLGFELQDVTLSWSEGSPLLFKAAISSEAGTVMHQDDSFKVQLAKGTEWVDIEYQIDENVQSKEQSVGR